MKAYVYTQYGPPEVLRLEDVPDPVPKDGEVLIRIMATAVNSADWRLRKADPFLVRLFFGLSKPKKNILGTVLSGIIEKTGNNVSKYKAGDEVFGLTEMHLGTYAEFVALPENSALALKPNNISHEEAAAIPFGGHTALHFLRKANLKAKQTILIYGASGSVGTSAIQLAKYDQAQVTAVCSSANVELVKSLGADHVIDYKKTDLKSIPEQYDIVYETVGKTPVPDMARLVKPGGILMLGSALFKGMIHALWISKAKKIKVITGQAEATSEGVRHLGELTEKGHLKPVVDKIYEFDQLPEAHRYAEAGHKKGNVVISLGTK